MKKLFLILILSAVIVIPATSMAKTDVFLNFGIGVPAPVYVAPSPIYVAPPPVVVYPRPYIVQPAPVIISPYGHYYGHHKYYKKHYRHFRYDDDDDYEYDD